MLESPLEIMVESIDFLVDSHQDIYEDDPSSCSMINLYETGGAFKNLPPDLFDMLQSYACDLEVSKRRKDVDKNFSTEEQRKAYEARLSKSRERRYRIASGIAGISTGFGVWTLGSLFSEGDFGNSAYMMGGLFVGFFAGVFESWYNNLGKLLTLDQTKSVMLGTKFYNDKLKDDCMRRSIACARANNREDLYLYQNERPNRTVENKKDVSKLLTDYEQAI